MATAIPNPVFAPSHADAARLAPVGLAAVFWTIAASFVQALRQGLRHGDWSAFSGCEPPRNDDDFDFFSRSAAYAYLRIQAEHEALLRDGDRFPPRTDTRTFPYALVR